MSEPKIHPEDPKLTAYLLGELEPEECAAIERTAAADAALRLAIEETLKLQGRLVDLLSGDAEKLLPRQRETIRRAARQADKLGKVEMLDSHRQARKFWIPMTAAAVIAAGVFVLQLIPSNESGSRAVMAKSERNEGSEARDIVIDADGAASPSPLATLGGSLQQMKRAIREEARLPSNDEVRIEEILANFSPRATGTTALWNGCVLAVETMPCPWKPSSALAIITVQGARDKDHDMLVSFDPGEVDEISHRIIVNQQASHSLPAGKVVVLVYEILAKGSQLGRVRWSVSGVEGPPIDLVMDLEKETSPDVRLTLLASAFAMWLRDEGEGLIDDSLVLGLAREVAATELDAGRMDFLVLVDEAVKLSNR